MRKKLSLDEVGKNKYVHTGIENLSTVFIGLNSSDCKLKSILSSIYIFNKHNKFKTEV